MESWKVAGTKLGDVILTKLGDSPLNYLKVTLPDQAVLINRVGYKGEITLRRSDGGSDWEVNHSHIYRAGNPLTPPSTASKRALEAHACQIVTSWVNSLGT